MSRDLKTKTKKANKDPFKAPIPVLTPEQTIIWLQGIKELMLEIWTKNPDRIPRNRRDLGSGESR